MMMSFTSRTSRTALLCLVLAGAGALLAPGLGAQASPAAGAASACDAGDLLARKTCLTAALSNAEAQLGEAREGVRAGAPDPTRARGVLDSATASWRAWRTAECALLAEVAVSVSGADRGEAQLACALDLTHSRIADLAALQARWAPVAPATGEPPMAPVSFVGPSSPPSKAGPSPAEFEDRAWRAACVDTACSASTSVRRARPDGTVIEQARLQVTPDADGRARVLSLLAIEPSADPDRDIAITVDNAPPIIFTARREHRAVTEANAYRLMNDDKADEALALMRSGLRAQVHYVGRDRTSLEAEFDLRGVSRALAWLETQSATTGTKAASASRTDPGASVADAPL